MTQGEVTKAEKCLSILLAMSHRETKRGNRIEFYQGRYIGAKSLMNELGYDVYESGGIPYLKARPIKKGVL